MQALKKIGSRVALVAVGLMAAGCYPKAGPAPGALSTDSVARASTRWPGVTPTALTTGRTVFLAKCNGCHNYPDLVAITEDHWPAIVARMGKKAEITVEEKDAVLHYVLAARAEQAPPVTIGSAPLVAKGQL